MERESGHLTRTWIAVCVLLACAGVVRSDQTGSDAETCDGNIESVDSTLTGFHYSILPIDDWDQGEAGDVILLTIAPEANLSPRIALNDVGDATIVWWRDKDIDEVLYVRRTAGSWSSERRVSDEGESSRNPEIATDGSTTWIAYEIASGLSTSIKVVGITDGPEPFLTSRALLGATVFTGNVDLKVHSESGRVWVSWIDGLTEVGWSAYDAESSTWDPTSHESYVNDDVQAVRSRIRARVLEEEERGD